jgi:uncharacterized membrane protein HdeD (DUF308 family)
MANSTDLHGVRWAGLDEMTHNWGWFFALGVVLVVLGLVAIGFSVLTTLASVVLVGWLLIASGAIQTVHAFWRERKWSGFFIDLFAGILSFVVGFMVVANPLVGAATLTLLIAMFLFIGGIERIIVSLMGHFHNRGWLLFNGVIDVALGVMIWRQWPTSALWVIGLFVGIDMVLSGWSVLMQGVAAKMLAKQAS